MMIFKIIIKSGHAGGAGTKQPPLDQAAPLETLRSIFSQYKRIVSETSLSDGLPPQSGGPQGQATEASRLRGPDEYAVIPRGV
jgi:hypothetical protein